MATARAEFIRSLYDLLATGDLDHVGELLAESIVWHEPATGIELVGRAAVEAHLHARQTATRPSDVIARDGIVVALVDRTTSGDGADVRRGCDVFRFFGDLVTEAWVLGG